MPKAFAYKYMKKYLPDIMTTDRYYNIKMILSMIPKALSSKNIQKKPEITRTHLQGGLKYFLIFLLTRFKYKTQKKNKCLFTIKINYKSYRVFR